MTFELLMFDDYKLTLRQAKRRIGSSLPSFARILCRTSLELELPWRLERPPGLALVWLCRLFP